MTNWKIRVDEFVERAPSRREEVARFVTANLVAVESAVLGQGPHNTTVDPEVGARMVVNISSAHVPAFCDASRKGSQKPYKNGYDLAKFRIGNPPPGTTLNTREMVDRALPLNTHDKTANIYFGAVELNGTGIRFYGDVCLVLRRNALTDDTVVLDRNSFDLVCPPICDIINRQPVSKQSWTRKREAGKLRGTWRKDIGAMASLKVLEAMGLRARRWTTGQISEAVRNDEDYMEVLKVGSFGTEQLQEARLSAADAAHDALIGDRMVSRPTPRIEALMWRNRRGRAEEELRRRDVPVRVVTTSGRTKE